MVRITFHSNYYYIMILAFYWPNEIVNSKFWTKYRLEKKLQTFQYSTSATSKIISHFLVWGANLTIKTATIWSIFWIHVFQNWKIGFTFRIFRAGYSTFFCCWNACFAIIYIHIRIIFVRRKNAVCCIGFWDFSVI